MKLSDCCNNFFASIPSMDEPSKIDMLCLKNATERFLHSGAKDDAFDVYYCFSEIFQIFGEGYGINTKNLINVLADHEAAAGSLLEKHRDHYSHSVYVFAIGLSIFQANSNYRKEFSRFFKITKDASKNFLYRWGLCALFHDVGYPFEIAFNSIKNYTSLLFNLISPRLNYDTTEFSNSTHILIAKKNRRYFWV